MNKATWDKYKHSWNQSISNIGQSKIHDNKNFYYQKKFYYDNKIHDKGSKNDNFIFQKHGLEDMESKYIKQKKLHI